MATKDYILWHTPQSPRAHGVAPKFVERAMTWAKSTNEIAGLIRGVLADGVVSESEAAYLRDWIATRPELLCDSLVRSLSDRIDRVFEDGVVTPDELEELRALLCGFCPSEEASPSTLPLDNPSPVVKIPGSTFCFTGKFISGKRSWCEDQVQARGGKPVPAVSSRLNFLVIGSVVSGAWRNQTYGKKIEEALGHKQSGHPVSIICEEYWLGFLKRGTREL
jgi:NAD-dependent DNA ligase